ncbi:Mitochodrial transcription termination factor-related [Macleaya cordata]|uniref:Mitochodrial transcription termination factor-related n=1 Tax=Macleaya cordata TaxID=56857 RepID=A0A200PVN2_MACCD|nr:Mitochodrial transcription termination factor-related [Macleaya cordata]
MLRVLYRDLRHHVTIREPTPIHFNLFGVLQNQNPNLKFISNIPEPTNPPSLTVDYLINTCGLPQKTALSTAEKIRLCSTEKPNSVISLFKNHGLTKTQIAELISKRPTVLLSDPDKILKPKIEFLYDLGVSGPNLAKLIASDPTLLTRSLEKQIIPSFNFLKTYIGTNSEILTTLKRSTWVLQYNLEKVMGPNIALLRDYNVTDCIISKLLIKQPRTLMQNTDRFKKIVEKVKSMGFKSSSPMFFHAVRTMAGVSNLGWEKKVAVYKEFGWSENDILSVFKKQPFCMLISEKKIRKGLEFYMEKLKWKSAEIFLRPSLLLLSLEKRIIPRCAVLEILKSKEIRIYKMKVSTILKMAERDFLERFVTAYEERIPEVMKAYKGGIEFAGFGELSRSRT